MATTLANVPDAQKTFDLIKTIGETMGTARDGQIKMDYALVEAAYNGSFNREKNKHGVGIDDAIQCAGIYFTARNKNVKFDHKADNQRKTASTMRKCIEFGARTGWGSGQPMALLNDFMNTFMKLRADANNVKRLDDAHNSLMRLIRTQLKRTDIIAGDELSSMCFKPVRNLADNLKLVAAIETAAKALFEGTAASNTVQDRSTEIETILGACRARKVAIGEEEKAQKQAEATAQMGDGLPADETEGADEFSEVSEALETAAA